MNEKVVKQDYTISRIKKVKAKVAKKTFFLNDPDADRLYIYLLLQSWGTRGNEYRRLNYMTNEHLSLVMWCNVKEVEKHMNFLKLCARVKDDCDGYLKVLQEDYDKIMSQEFIDYCSKKRNPMYLDAYETMLEYWARRRECSIADIFNTYGGSRELSYEEVAYILKVLSTLKEDGYIEFDVTNVQIINDVPIDTFKIKWVSPKPIKAGYKTQIFKEQVIDRLVDAIHKARERYC